MEIGSTFGILDFTHWLRQQAETRSKFTNLSNVVCDIFSIIPHGDGVEASFFFGQDNIGWSQSYTTGETLCEKVVVRQFAQANKCILADIDPEVDTTNRENNAQMKIEAEQRKFYRMAKIHSCLEMWQGSQNLCATQKESRGQPSR
jgi:hypothetical protein